MHQQQIRNFEAFGAAAQTRPASSLPTLQATTTVSASKAVAHDREKGLAALMESAQTLRLARSATRSVRRVRSATNM
jgi:hypothetical protein